MTKKQKQQPLKRNPIALELVKGIYRNKQVQSKKVYKRKKPAVNTDGLYHV